MICSNRYSGSCELIQRNQKLNPAPITFLRFKDLIVKPPVLVGLKTYSKLNMLKNYESKVAAIYFDLGQAIAADPNSPILTDKGFVLVKDLEKGAVIMGYENPLTGRGSPSIVDRIKKVDYLGHANVADIYIPIYHQVVVNQRYIFGDINITRKLQK